MINCSTWKNLGTYTLMFIFLPSIVACSSTSKTTDSQNEQIISEVSSQIKNNQSALAKGNLLKILKPISKVHQDRLADLLLTEAKRGIGCSVSVVNQIQSFGVRIGLESYYLFGKPLSLCHPLLKETLAGNSKQATTILQNEIVDQTRIKRFNLISNLHETAIKKQKKKISLDQYAKRLIIISYIHGQLAKGLTTSLKASAKLCNEGRKRHCIFESEIKQFVSEIQNERAIQRSNFMKLTKGSSKKDSQVAWGLINLSFSPYLHILK